VLLSRMLTLLLGLCNSLDPTFNPLDIIRPYAEKYLLGKSESRLSFVSGFLRRTVTNALSLPEEMRQFLQKAKKGELETTNVDVRNGARLLYNVGQQLVFTLLLIATAFLGFLFHQKEEGNYAHLAGWVGGFLVILLYRTMRRSKRHW
jgi:ubiquinone biosynthesis protein